MSHRIVISSGDFNGIGPEVILKTLASHPLKVVTPIILSSQSVIDFYLENLNIDLVYHHAKKLEDVKTGTINVLESYRDEKPIIKPGQFNEQSGKCAMLAVDCGIQLCRKQWADALVTAPISKEAVNLAGYNIPGHTEFLAEQTSTTDFMMMLVNNNLRVGLVTGHIPIAKIASELSVDKIARNIRIMHKSLQRDFNIADPKIAVFGLNPHAGDGGVIGTEEIDFIKPAIQIAKENDINSDGPYPADGFFGNRKQKHFDGILAMYHDQGLVPFKTLSFGAGINFTAGLPIIRTSPDHGTAFDIADKNQANPESFKKAFDLALQLSKNRKSEAIS